MAPRSAPIDPATYPISPSATRPIALSRAPDANLSALRTRAHELTSARAQREPLTTADVGPHAP